MEDSIHDLETIDYTGGSPSDHVSALRYVSRILFGFAALFASVLGSATNGKETVR